MCQYLPPDHHYLNQTNYSRPLEFSSGFSHLWLEVFHISLQIRKAQPRERKKRTSEQTRTWVSSKCQRDKSVTFFVHSVSKRERVLERKLSLLLALVNPASTGQPVLAAAYLTSVDLSPLCSTLTSLTDLFCRLVSSAPFC